MSGVTDAPASLQSAPVDGLAGAVMAALATVRDPELDEPVTTLGFVSSCTVSAKGQTQVRLRLPTYFCAPNFAFLMVADAYDAVAAVPGVSSAEVILDDHFASDAINAGVAARAGFVGSFDGEAVDELDELRATFLRKAVLAGTDLVCRPLAAAGRTPAELAALTLGSVPCVPRAHPPPAAPGRPRPPGRRRRRADYRPADRGPGRPRRRSHPLASCPRHPDRYRREHLDLLGHAPRPLPGPFVIGRTCEGRSTA